MKTKINSLANYFLALLAICVIISSCKKKEEEDKDTSATRDNAFAEAVFNDAGNIADEAAQNGTLTNYKITEGTGVLVCAVVTFINTVNTNQDTIIVDFQNGCTGADGRIRKGKVIVYYTGRYKNIGSTHTITFDNYYVNENKVDGTYTVTNMGFNAAGHLNWDVQVSGIVTLANGNGTITWNSTRNRELLGALGSVMLNSNDTSIVWNKSIWGVTGSANGTSSGGASFTANITSQLIRNFTCTVYKRHFTKGTFDFTPSNKATRTVDFGSGACDDQATVTIKGKTYTVTLK